jgi:hypothetical protein
LVDAAPELGPAEHNAQAKAQACINAAMENLTAASAAIGTFQSVVRNRIHGPDYVRADVMLESARSLLERARAELANIAPIPGPQKPANF